MLIIQYNARSLTKANLVQFKYHLHLYKPLVALISETYWKDHFSIKFKNYHVTHKNRANRPGGGVAILIHKLLQFNQLTTPQFKTLEAIGVSIAIRKNSQNQIIDIFSVYVPNRSTFEEEELNQLIQGRSGNLIVGGDFNAHHGRWETTCNHPNQSGRAIAHLLEEDNDLELATPINLGTRQNPNTLTFSTIDLTLMSPHLALTSETTTGPHLSSDHLPIHIKIRTEPMISTARPPTWNFKDADWTAWNDTINKIINNSEYYTLDNTEAKYPIYYNAIMDVNKTNKIKLSKSSDEIKREPTQPWWTVKCKKAVAQARRARNRCDPSKGGVNCQSNKEAWKKKESQKKRIINKAKKEAMDRFVNNLCPKNKRNKNLGLCQGLDKRYKSPRSLCSPIKDPETNQIVTSTKEKARIFSIQYDHQRDDIPDDPRLELNITRGI
jgi:endonuclease/exonuclease/phosphatase family metal-dependent hydrolase